MPLFTDFDPEEGLISPGFEKLGLALPEYAVMAFLSERHIQSFAEAHEGYQAGKFMSLTKNFPVWVVKIGEEEVTLIQAPAGAPAAVLMEERLFTYGTEKLLAVGCCGALTDLPENTFLPVKEAFRDEGTSFHYLPESDSIVLDEEPLAHIEEIFAKRNIPCMPCTVWTTDAFFRETKEKIEQVKEAGCQAVDMECSALAACARFRGKTFAQILFTADTLASMRHDERNWGKDSRNASVALAMEAVLGM